MSRDVMGSGWLHVTEATFLYEAINTCIPSQALDFCILLTTPRSRRVIFNALGAQNPTVRKQPAHISKRKREMPYSLDDFCKDARTILKADSGPAGVEKVKGNMERLIKDGDFIKHYFRADVLIRSGKERSEHRSKP